MLKAVLYSVFLICTGFFSTTTANSYQLNAYDFKFKDIDGNIIKLSEHKGKVVLIINTASFCGFTKQFEHMQTLWDEYKTKDFILIGVPSQDFQQEHDTDAKVKEFCELTFGVNFPMTSITSVRGKNAHPFYKWAKLTYGSKAIPKWNFHKILIDKNGSIVDTYSSITKLTDKKAIKKIEELL